MTILLFLLVWVMIGDILLALRPWEPDDVAYRIYAILFWPTSVWWVLRDLLRSWRNDLYFRNKYRYEEEDTK